VALLLIDLRNRTSRAPRVAGGDPAVLHFVDPIAGFGDDRIVRGQEQSFAAFLHDILQQLKSALGIGGIEVSSGLIRQDHARIIGQCPGDRYALLFPSGEVAAWPV